MGTDSVICVSDSDDDEDDDEPNAAVVSSHRARKAGEGNLKKTATTPKETSVDAERSTQRESNGTRASLVSPNLSHVIVALDRQEHALRVIGKHVFNMKTVTDDMLQRLVKLESSVDTVRAKVSNGGGSGSTTVRRRGKIVKTEGRVGGVKGYMELIGFQIP